MLRGLTGRGSWIGLAIALWLLGSEAPCQVFLNPYADQSQTPLENPIGDMGDASGEESESENEREFEEDDNLFDEKAMAFDRKINRKSLVSPWDLLHESPSGQPTFPPPKF
jgi:hypothetical protein